MRIYTNKLDIDKFKKDFSSLYRDDDKEQVLENIIKIINESACSISSFLKKVDSIEERKIQKYCRQAAVSQKYNVDLDYSGRYPYIETSGYGEVLMIKLKNSTAILSKYGDILINEGEIWTQRGTNYGLGFITRKVIDGQVSYKYGFIDNYGNRVLPCVFDGIEAHLYESPCPRFGQIKFRLRILGNIDSIDKNKLEPILHETYEDTLYGISEDSILFTLTSHRRRKDEDDYVCQVLENHTNDSCSYDESMKELKSLLSPLLISKERLLEIVESK